MRAELTERCRVAVVVGAVAVGAVLTVGAGVALGQEGGGQPSGQYFVIFEEHPFPAQLDVYESSSREFAAMVGEHAGEMPHYAFTVLQGEDLTFYFVAPVDNMAGLDTINREYDHFVNAMGGDDLRKKMEPNFSSIASSRQWMTFQPPGFAYRPANPRLKPEEVGFYAFELFHLTNGERDVVALVKDWIDLYKRKEIADGVDVFWGVIGTDSPLLIVSVGARDAVDYETQQQKIRGILGAEAEPLIRRTWAMTRSYEVKRAWVRRDLSIPPAPAAPAPAGAAR